MKKLFALCLTLVLCLCCLASCRWFYTDVRNEFFSEDFLSQCKIKDMPVPPHVDNSVYSSGGSWGHILYLNLTKAEYEQYVEDLLNYLRSKEDIYYLGYSVGSGLLAEMMPYDEIAPITDSYDIKGEEHRFFYSTVDGLGNMDMLDTPVEIGILRESGKLKFDNFEYNTEIILCNNFLASAMWNLCGAEHTYDEGIEYKIPGSNRTITEYTCVHCGSTKSSDFIGDMKSYNVTIEDTDADHYILDRRKSVISGVIVGFRTEKIMDADLKFVVNGTRIYPRETEDDKWIYEFVMPCEDIVITTEIVGDGPALANHFLRDLTGCEWLKEICAEDIGEIKIISEYVGVAPGNLKDIESSTDEAVIARIFEEYYMLETAPLPYQNGQIAGGSAVTVRFVLKSGTEKTLYINNGNYRDPDDNYFELLSTPKFEETDNATKAYGFITYLGTGTVYDKDNNPVCEIPIDELVFIITDYDSKLFANGYDYCVDTEFGKLRFVKVDIFATDECGSELVGANYYFIEEGNTEFCYRLVGKNLDELIAEYSATSTD